MIGLVSVLCCSVCIVTVCNQLNRYYLLLLLISDIITKSIHTSPSPCITIYCTKLYYMQYAHVICTSYWFDNKSYRKHSRECRIYPLVPNSFHVLPYPIFVTICFEKPGNRNCHAVLISARKAGSKRERYEIEKKTVCTNLSYARKVPPATTDLRIVIESCLSTDWRRH